MKSAEWSFLQTDVDQSTFVNNETGIALALAEPAVRHSFPLLQRLPDKFDTRTMIEVLS
jgi:hypothetical protein